MTRADEMDDQTVTALTWPTPTRTPADSQQLYHAVVLGDNIMISGVGGNVTITTERPPYLVEPFPTWTDPVPATQARARPGQLLLARHQVVPFVGRDAELQRIADWMATPGAVSAWLVHAAGGQGKTRLASHVAKECADAGWAVWRVLHESTFSGGYRMEMPAGGGLLAVVDYADRWPVSHLLDLIRHMVSMNLQTGLRIRVLLLARSARGWWPALRNRLVNTHRIEAFGHALPPLGEQVNRSQLYQEARRRFAAAMRVDGTDDLPLPTKLADKAFGHILTLHMGALVAVDAHHRKAAVPTEPHALSSYLLLRELDHWHALHTRAEKPMKISPDMMGRTVYVATLTGAIPRQGARAALKSVSLATEYPDADEIIDEHRFCYPPDDPVTVLQELRPDRLGEDLIALSIPGHAHVDDDDAWQTDGWCLTAADLLLIQSDEAALSWTPRAVTVLVETARRWPHVAVNVLYPLIRQRPNLAIAAGGATLIRLAELPHIDLDVLEAIDTLLPAGRDIDLDVAAAKISTLLLPRRVAITDPLYRAARYDDHAQRLANAGQWEEAQVAAEKAVGICRQATKVQSGIMPALAMSLNNLGLILSQLGRHLDALRVAQEAVDIHKRLAQADPATHLAALAMSLINLGGGLAQLGSVEEALARTQDAAELYRRLAEADPAAHLPSFATAVSNFAAFLSQVGRMEEALAPAEEAVAIRRRLAEADPAAHLPDLAMSLNNLGMFLSKVRRMEEALAPAQEAVTIRRRLAEANPAAYTIPLAEALDNLGLRLAELGHKEEALAPAQEAVTIRRRLAEADPAAHLPDLARSLNNLGMFLGQLGRATEALVPAQEAVTIRRRLAEADPATDLPNLATSLNNLAGDLCQLGRAAEALVPAEEAVAIRRRLAEANPAAYLPKLAGSLNNLAATLAQLARGRDALAAGHEAVELYRRLAENNPAVYLPNFATCLLAYAQVCVKVEAELPEALEAVSEAISLYEQMFERLPQAFGANLWSAYQTLADILHGLGEVDRAAGLRRQLKQTSG